MQWTKGKMLISFLSFIPCEFSGLQTRFFSLILKNSPFSILPISLPSNQYTYTSIKCLFHLIYRSEGRGGTGLEGEERNHENEKKKIWENCTQQILLKNNNLFLLIAFERERDLLLHLLMHLLVDYFMRPDWESNPKPWHIGWRSKLPGQSCIEQILVLGPLLYKCFSNWNLRDHKIKDMAQTRHRDYNN